MTTFERSKDTTEVPDGAMWHTWQVKGERGEVILSLVEHTSPETASKALDDFRIGIDYEDEHRKQLLIGSNGMPWTAQNCHWHSPVPVREVTEGFFYCETYDPCYFDDSQSKANEFGLLWMSHGWSNNVVYFDLENYYREVLHGGGTLASSSGEKPTTT